MINRLLYRVTAILLILFVALSSILFFPLALLIWLFTIGFDRNLHLLHQFTSLWATSYLRLSPAWKVSIHGKKNIVAGQTYIIVSNHQSVVDILAAFSLFIQFKWVSRAILFNIPLLGWNMYLNQYIKVIKRDQTSIRQMYKACAHQLANNSSVFLFPEGSRSKDGRLRHFKEGAFVLAKRHNLPILPIVINGSRSALRKPGESAFILGKAHIEIEVLSPVYPENNLSVRELSNLVKGHIQVKVREEAAQNLQPEQS